MHHLPCVIFFLVGQSFVSGVPKFKEDASKFMDVGFNKGRTGTRLAEIAVKIRPSQMFEEGEDLDVEGDLVLEVKSGDGCWTQVDESPVRRGKDKQMWRVKVVPCQEHSVRLGLKKDGCVEYLQYPEPVGPATAEEIANSHFRPSTPEDVTIAPLTNDSVVVSWTPSPCAESYELFYESHDGDDSGNMTVSAGFGSVTVSELKNCTDYTIYVTAIVGDEFSGEAEAEFTTCKVNGTTATEKMNANQIDDDTQAFCEQAVKECEPEPEPTLQPRFGDITISDFVMLNASDVEAQKSQAIFSYKPLFCTILAQIALVLIVA